MEPQNIYDDADFFERYLTLDRQVHGLDGTREWPVVRSMVPTLTGRKVVDLGCGLGWFSRWAAEQGAASVIGIDVSTKMISQARARTTDGVIEYRGDDLDQLRLAPDSTDVVFSSLALHYVRDLDRLLSVLATAMTPGATIVFSVEHPIYSAPTNQTFETTEGGERHWPLNNYLVEGERVTNWFVNGVRKQHRTVATYINALIDAGFSLDHIVEWGPSDEDVKVDPTLADDRHRPWFLLVRSTLPDSREQSSSQ